MGKRLTLVLVFILGFLAYGGMNAFFDYTNTMEFCTSCHSMQVNLEEYKETIHYKNGSGVRAECSDCHVPHALLPKIKAKIFAAKDVYHEIMGTIDTDEKYEEHRWGMASSVWKKMEASNSRECRSCHSLEAMDYDEQDKMAVKRHSKMMDKGQTCIDCHKGIAHEEPDEPDETPAS